MTNLSGQVEITVQGRQSDIDAFCIELIDRAPPLAKPAIQQNRCIQSPELASFDIQQSRAATQIDIQIPPDYFLCNDCHREITDSTQRRYRYPFTNCTQCGPRYSIIQRLPYDRDNTSMQSFRLCPDCEKEFNTPEDRRFHAQPLACPQCGPSLNFTDDVTTLNNNEDSLGACIKALRSGKIIAVKGIGGYHLLCDALNHQAVATLRQRKNRPDKPLAVMFPMPAHDPSGSLLLHTNAGKAAIRQLTGPQRPIVLVRKKTGSALAGNIAPGMQEIGALLPYSPLHQILLDDFRQPVVATSGNISGEPVITDNSQAQHKLAVIADAFLHHNRPIVRPADDSVMRIINDTPTVIRAGRGMTPLPLKLPLKLKQPVIAVGGHMKTTITLAWQDHAVISPHISDLDSKRAMDVFRQVINDLQQLYQVEARTIVCDAHPQYQSHQWALKQSLPVFPVAHHHAHAATISGQHPQISRWLMFCWDGTGLGTDNSLWGGETFYGSPGNWQRLASLRPFNLPGGDRAGRQPWRSAAALRWENGDLSLPDITDADIALMAWQKKINCPQTSAIGRLFDAAACLIMGIDNVSFEGQAAMLLEAAIKQPLDDYIDLEVTADDNGLFRTDWAKLLDIFSDNTFDVNNKACIFHNTLAHNIIKQSLLFKADHDFAAIGLSGGVFQNRYLVEKTCSLAKQHNIRCIFSSQIPVNDGGLSYGQVIEYLYNQAD